MGTQSVTSPITNDSMRKRALELQAAFSTVGYDFSTPVTKNMTLIANYTCEKNIVTKTLPTTVYTSGWDKKDTQNILISHVLKLPEEIKQENPIKVKISNLITRISIVTPSVYIKAKTPTKS